MSIIIFLLVCLGLFSSSCSAQSTTDVIYTGRTSTCTSAWDLGQAIFCCDGACIDGTGDEDPSGLCKYFADGCNDPITPPACASLDQVFVFDNFNGVDAGIGNCYYWCTWGQFNYSWSCCDCPQGYTAVASTCAELTLPNSYECMGCPPGFALTVNLSPSGGYFCFDETLQSVLCDLGRDVKNVFDIAGRVSTFVGTVCPTTKLKDAAITAFQAAFSVMESILSPSDSGARFDAATTVVGAIKSFALGAVIVAGAAELGIDLAIAFAGFEIWEMTCFWNGIIGLAVTGLSGLDAYLLKQCPSLSSKRSISEQAWDGVIPISDKSSRRDNTYNPCAEFLSFFPANDSSIVEFNNACNQLQYDDPSGVNDTTIADAMTSLQQLCSSWWDSGIGGFLIDFTEVLAALEAAVPYCNSTAALTSTWSAAASSTSSSSYPPSSSSTDQSSISSNGLLSRSSASSLSTILQSSSSTSSFSTGMTSTTSKSLSTTSSSSTVSASTSSHSLSSSGSSSFSSLHSTTSKSLSSFLKSSSSTGSSATSSFSSKSSASPRKSSTSTSSGSMKSTSSSTIHSTLSQTSSRSPLSASSRTSTSSIVHTTSGSASKTSSSSHTSSQNSFSSTKSSGTYHSFASLSTSSTSSIISKTTSTPTWNAAGCYTDNVLGLGRTLTKGVSIPGGGAEMTVQACQTACQEAGYIYAGLEYSQECWCGNAFANGGVYLGPDGTNGCTDTCAGNKQEICGGSKRLSVYSLG